MTLDYDDRYFHGKPQNSFHKAVNIPDVVVFPRWGWFIFSQKFCTSIACVFFCIDLWKYLQWKCWILPPNEINRWLGHAFYDKLNLSSWCRMWKPNYLVLRLVCYFWMERWDKVMILWGKKCEKYVIYDDFEYCKVQNNDLIETFTSDILSKDFRLDI